MDEDNKQLGDTGYRSYGEFNFYKQIILSYLFEVAHGFTNLNPMLPNKEKLKKEELNKRYDFLVGMRSFAILLMPKIKKLKSKQQPEFENIKKFKTSDLIEISKDYKKILGLYYDVVNLVETLGYSDMSYQKEDDFDLEW